MASHFRIHDKPPSGFEIPRMNFLQGKTVLYKGKELISADVAMKKKNLFLYYFTSGNCEACKTFDNKLKDVYEAAIMRKMDMAIIIISYDSDKDSFQENLTNNYQDWYAVQYEDELGPTLMYNYGVTHIPTLIVVRRDGEIVTREGRADVEKIGINVLVTWSE